MKDAAGWWAGEEGEQAVEASLGSGAAHHLLHSQATEEKTLAQPKKPGTLSEK